MQAVGPSVNQVITLTSATGFQVSAKRPPAGVPGSCAARQIAELAELIVSHSRLRSAVA